MLVHVWAASGLPGPLPAFYLPLFGALTRYLPCWCMSGPLLGCLAHFLLSIFLPFALRVSISLPFAPLGCLWVASEDTWGALVGALGGTWGALVGALGDTWGGGPWVQVLTEQGRLGLDFKPCRESLNKP